MLTGLVTHLGSSAIGGLFVAASLWLRARAKSEESAGEAVRVKASSDAAITAHLIATVETLKTENVEVRQRHEECERHNVECNKNLEQLRHDFETFRSASVMSYSLPPRLP